MRILHIIGTLSPEAGGPTESVRVLLSYGPIGYAGEVVTLDDPKAPFLRDLQFPVHALGPTRTKYGFNSKLLPWLRENRSRFDGVVVNGLWQYCGFAAWRAMSGNTPYVVFTHGMLDPYFKHAFPLKHIKKWLYWVPAEYRILRDAYRVLFTSTAEKRLAEQSFWLHRWNPFVVPYGASGPPPKDRDLLREAFFAKCPQVRGKRFLLFLGRIHKKKGCDLLIQAFASIADEDPELHLVMAGPDQQLWRAHLAEMAESGGVGQRVHWPGMLTGDAKWGAFYASEAFVLPSHQENFGIAVAEALGCGTPVLLADKVNIAEDIARDNAGLMETDTIDGTLRLLKRWIATPPEERAAMADRAEECFHRRYNMRENAKAIIRLFEAATQGEAVTQDEESSVIHS
ncbi:glycosyltransferase [Edaphobacter aggregans]|uniref:glycosyltransferase n=1 Tax=Edaphobacter aggregans TaxID=570835 RepID=UPI00054F4751|nr:glycosyltransferase [Edaphobacter aggregans]